MRITSAVLLLLCSACATTTTTPALSPLAAKIDDTLARMVPFGLSGSVLVADANGVLLSKGYGAGLKSDTLYDMGSITKTFTATAVVMLEQDGKLSLDDALAKFFPDAPADKRGLTLKQILSHSAGLIDLTGSDYDPVPKEQFLADVMRAPLLSKPGATWSYSNAGYSILSAIVENAGGKPYETFLRERLFEPAGMRDTGYRVPKKDRARAAHTLTPPVDHGSPVDRLEKAGGIHWILLGNGGMITTVDDLYRWEAFLRRNKALEQRLMTPLFKRSETMHPAVAWTLETVDGESVMHHGSDAPELGVNGEYRRYPDANFAVIFLGNTRVNGWSPRRIVGRVVRRVSKGETIDVPSVVRADDAQKYAGRYTLADGSTIDIRAEDGHLVAGLIGQEAIDLFITQRSEQSLKNRRMFNEKALEVAREQKLENVTILGTSRRDRGVFMTTLRAGDRVLRFAWSNNAPVAEGDDNQLRHIGFFSVSPIPFALERPLWREQGDTFAFYDIYSGETIRVVFDGSGLSVQGLGIRASKP